MAEGEILLQSAKPQGVTRLATHHLIETPLQLFAQSLKPAPTIQRNHILVLPVVLILHKGQHPAYPIHQTNQLELVDLLLEVYLHLVLEDVLVYVVGVLKLGQNQEWEFLYPEVERLYLAMAYRLVELDLKILHILLYLPLAALHMNLLFGQ